MDKKYSMTKEDNIFFAKRKLADNLYKSANLEGIAVTFAETVDFLNNVNTGTISVEDMFKLKDLKDAWEFILDSIDEELTTDYIKKIHFEICKGQDVKPLGEYREKGVGISGTNWRPELPENCDYDKELNDIVEIEDKLEMCIKLFCWIQRAQMFMDGNKRVANLVANKEMIKNGLGIIAVPVEKIGEYTKLLVEFYESNNYDIISKFIYDYCLDGIE